MPQQQGLSPQQLQQQRQIMQQAQALQGQLKQLQKQGLSPQQLRIQQQQLLRQQQQLMQQAPVAQQPPTQSSGPAAGSESGNCAGAYQQCGGHGWNGPTCCEDGCTCNKNGDYYAQCMPRNGGGTCAAVVGQSARLGPLPEVAAASWSAAASLALCAAIGGLAALAVQAFRRARSTYQRLPTCGRRDIMLAQAAEGRADPLAHEPRGEAA
mmetsp:Transcript_105682/g.331132  ORF Transcript_105682/g.331132 Transcript_105682/m.331132 type:complete len:210 (+) Transcript_105682:2-631(+)